MKPTLRMHILTLAFSVVLAQSPMTSGQVHRITGTVVDYLARPVQGAEVALHEKTGHHTAEMRDEIRTTDRDGRFTFTADVNLSLLRVYVLVARKDGFALGWDYLQHIDGNVIVLERPCSIGGIVVDANDRPIAAATVRAVPKSSQLRRLEQLPILAPPSWLTTQSDDDGKFLFDAFSADVSTDFRVKTSDRELVYEYSPHMMTLSGFEAGRTDIRLVLPGEVPVQGQVIDAHSGTAVDGAGVLVHPKDISPGANPFIPFATTTGSDGRFSFQGVPPGERYIAVSVPPGTGLVDRRVTFEVEVGAPMTEVTAELRRGGTIDIVATEEQTGEPISGLPVRFWQAIQNERSDFYKDACTDANGTLSVAAPAGPCAFSTRSDRFIPMFYEGTATVPQGGTVEADVSLDGYRNVSGTVLDASGQPVSDALVTGVVRASDYLAKNSGRTDGAGRFEVSLPPGHLPGVWIARHVSGNSAGLSIAEQVTGPLRITMKPAVLIGGRVVDPNGNGIAAARVESNVGVPQLHVSMPYAPEVVTDSQGRFELKGSAAERAGLYYPFFVSACGYGNWQQRVTVPQEPGTRIELEPMILIPADRSISGVVVDANRAPVAGALVSAYGRGQASRTTVSDIGGRFVLRRLCKAPVRIDASVSDRPGGTIEAQGGAHDVEVVLGRRGVHTGLRPLLGAPLPDWKGLIDLNPEQTRGKPLLVCFFDYQQRPSRNTLLELAGQAETLNQKDVVAIAVQASKVDDDTLAKWIGQNGVTFPVGTIPGDVDETRLAWGVKSLPWLILTDRDHVVRLEGMGLGEVDRMLKEMKDEQN